MTRKHQTLLGIAFLLVVLTAFSYWNSSSKQIQPSEADDVADFNKDSTDGLLSGPDALVAMIERTSKAAVPARAAKDILHELDEARVIEAANDPAQRELLDSLMQLIYEKGGMRNALNTSVNVSDTIDTVGLGTRITALEHLRSEAKFTDGSISIDLRSPEKLFAMRQTMNESIDNIIGQLRTEPSVRLVLSHYRTALAEFDRIGVFDTVEKEAVCD